MVPGISNTVTFRLTNTMTIGISNTVTTTVSNTVILEYHTATNRVHTEYHIQSLTKYQIQQTSEYKNVMAGEVQLKSPLCLSTKYNLMHSADQHYPKMSDHFRTVVLHHLAIRPQYPFKMELR